METLESAPPVPLMGSLWLAKQSGSSSWCLYFHGHFRDLLLGWRVTLGTWEGPQGWVPESATGGAESQSCSRESMAHPFLLSVLGRMVKWPTCN